jgi:solute carrier family 35 protein E1
MTSPVDKFPPFHDDSHDVAADEGTTPVQYVTNDTWQPRRAGPPSWVHSAESRGSKHRPRKSISEALSTFRTGNTGMSTNAHELAEALRAPVSVKLIVRQRTCSDVFFIYSAFTYQLKSLGALPYLVYDFGPDKYIV